MLTLGIVCVALIISAPLRAQDGSPIKSDERVVLFDTAGWLDEAANTWHVPIAGWIFEPEEDSATRALLLRQFAAVLDLPPDSMDSEVFRRRAAAFFVDNERGKRVPVRVGSGVATRCITATHVRCERTCSKMRNSPPGRSTRRSSASARA